MKYLTHDARVEERVSPVASRGMVAGDKYSLALSARRPSIS